LQPPKKQRIAHSQKPGIHNAVALPSPRVMTPKASVSTPQPPVVMPVAQSVDAAASQAPAVTSRGERSILLQQN